MEEGAEAEVVVRRRQREEAEAEAEAVVVEHRPKQVAVEAVVEAEEGHHFE